MERMTGQAGEIRVLRGALDTQEVAALVAVLAAVRGGTSQSARPATPRPVTPQLKAWVAHPGYRPDLWHTS